MAALKAVSIVEQNGNTLAGCQVTSATYAGTNTVADLVIKVGFDSPLVQIVGTQTASTVYVGLDTANAYHGAQVVISRNTQTVGTSIIQIYSGLAGTGFQSVNEVARIGQSSTATGQFLNNVGVAVVAFDGVAGVWR